MREKTKKVITRLKEKKLEKERERNKLLDNFNINPIKSWRAFKWDNKLINNNNYHLTQTHFPPSPPT